MKTASEKRQTPAVYEPSSFFGLWVWEDVAGGVIAAEGREFVGALAVSLGALGVPMGDVENEVIQEKTVLGQKLRAVLILERKRSSAIGVGMKKDLRRGIGKGLFEKPNHVGEAKSKTPVSY